MSNHCVKLKSFLLFNGISLFVILLLLLKSFKLSAKLSILKNLEKSTQISNSKSISFNLLSPTKIKAAMAFTPAYSTTA